MLATDSQPPLLTVEKKQYKLQCYEGTLDNGEKVAKMLMASGFSHGACAQCSPKSRFLRIRHSSYFKVPISHFFLLSETRSGDMFCKFTNVNENS